MLALLRLHVWKMVPTSAGLRGLRDKSLVSAGTQPLVLCPLWTSIARASTHLCGPRKREYKRPPGQDGGARGFKGWGPGGKYSPRLKTLRVSSAINRSHCSMHAHTCTGQGLRLQRRQEPLFQYGRDTRTNGTAHKAREQRELPLQYAQAAYCRKQRCVSE